MTERGVSEIMSHRDRFGQVLVEMKRARDASRDLRDFKGMREAGTVVVACRCKKQALQSPGAREEGCPVSREFTLPLLFCSLPTIIGLVDAATLLRAYLASKPRIQMLIPVRNTLTDTHRNYVLPTIWAFRRPVKLAQKIKLA